MAWLLGPRRGRSRTGEVSASCCLQPGRGWDSAPLLPPPRPGLGGGGLGRGLRGSPREGCVRAWTLLGALCPAGCHRSPPCTSSCCSPCLPPAASPPCTPLLPPPRGTATPLPWPFVGGGTPKLRPPQPCTHGEVGASSAVLCLGSPHPQTFLPPSPCPPRPQHWVSRVVLCPPPSACLPRCVLRLLRPGDPRTPSQEAPRARTPLCPCTATPCHPLPWHPLPPQGLGGLWPSNTCGIFLGGTSRVPWGGCRGGLEQGGL